MKSNAHGRFSRTVERTPGWLSHSRVQVADPGATSLRPLALHLHQQPMLTVARWLRPDPNPASLGSAAISRWTQALAWPGVSGAMAIMRRYVAEVRQATPAQREYRIRRQSLTPTATGPAIRPARPAVRPPGTAAALPLSIIAALPVLEDLAPAPATGHDWAAEIQPDNPIQVADIPAHSPAELLPASFGTTSTSAEFDEPARSLGEQDVEQVAKLAPEPAEGKFGNLPYTVHHWQPLSGVFFQVAHRLLAGQPIPSMLQASMPLTRQLQTTSGTLSRPGHLAPFDQPESIAESRLRPPEIVHRLHSQTVGQPPAPAAQPVRPGPAFSTPQPAVQRYSGPVAQTNPLPGLPPPTTGASPVPVHTQAIGFQPAAEGYSGPAGQTSPLPGPPPSATGASQVLAHPLATELLARQAATLNQLAIAHSPVSVPAVPVAPVLVAATLQPIARPSASLTQEPALWPVPAASSQRPVSHADFEYRHLPSPAPAVGNWPSLAVRPPAPASQPAGASRLPAQTEAASGPEVTGTAESAGHLAAVTTPLPPSARLAANIVAQHSPGIQVRSTVAQPVTRLALMPLLAGEPLAGPHQQPMGLVAIQAAANAAGDVYPRQSPGFEYRQAPAQPQASASPGALRSRSWLSAPTLSGATHPATSPGGTIVSGDYPPAAEVTRVETAGPTHLAAAETEPTVARPVSAAAMPSGTVIPAIAFQSEQAAIRVLLGETALFGQHPSPLQTQVHPSTVALRSAVALSDEIRARHPAASEVLAESIPAIQRAAPEAQPLESEAVVESPASRSLSALAQVTLASQYPIALQSLQSSVQHTAQTWLESLATSGTWLGITIPASSHAPERSVRYRTAISSSSEPALWAPARRPAGPPGTTSQPANLVQAAASTPPPLAGARPLSISALPPTQSSEHPVSSLQQPAAASPGMEVLRLPISQSKVTASQSRQVHGTSESAEHLVAASQPRQVTSTSESAGHLVAASIAAETNQPIDRRQPTWPFQIAATPILPRLVQPGPGTGVAQPVSDFVAHLATMLGPATAGAGRVTPARVTRQTGTAHASATVTTPAARVQRLPQTTPSLPTTVTQPLVTSAFQLGGGLKVTSTTAGFPGKSAGPLAVEPASAAPAPVTSVPAPPSPTTQPAFRSSHSDWPILNWMQRWTADRILTTHRSAETLPRLPGDTQAQRSQRPATPASPAHQPGVPAVLRRPPAFLLPPAPPAGEPAAMQVLRRLPASQAEKAMTALEMLPLLGTGEPLPTAVRQQMETLLGKNLSGIRLYTSAAAEMLGAEAFTSGERIVFAPGRLEFRGSPGVALLGHELSHAGQTLAFKLAAGAGPVIEDPEERAARQQEQAVQRIMEHGWPEEPQPQMEVRRSPQPLVTRTTPATSQQPDGSTSSSTGPWGLRMEHISIAREGTAQAEVGLAIQRTEGLSSSQPTTQISAPPTSPVQPAKGPDLDELAQQVYGILKSRLRAEQERNQIYAHRT